MSTILGKRLSKLFFDQGDGKRTIQSCALSATKPTDAEVIAAFNYIEEGDPEPLTVTVTDSENSIDCSGHRNIYLILSAGVQSVNLEKLLFNVQYIIKVKNIDGNYVIYGNSSKYINEGYLSMTGQSDYLTPNAGKVDIFKAQTVGEGNNIYFKFFQQNLVS